MTLIDSFDQPPPRVLEDDAAFILRLEAYEGPIDVLLDQARDQKVDLTQVSILALAEQYLAFIERARRLRLDLAADYLVMAAWLAYLKSRLLLPAQEDDGREEPTGEELAAALAFQLQRLSGLRQAAGRMMANPRLGADVFARGAPDPVGVIDRPVWTASLYDLLKSYAQITRRRQVRSGGLKIETSRLHSTDDAIHRFRRLLGGLPGWTVLASFLPPRSADPLIARSALAATFAASLELAKAGEVEVRQAGPFEPIYLRRREGLPVGGEEEAAP